ncbi:AAA family ATPase [Zhihengliuella salsuginis]|uniref:Chromosome partitioning protein n=1 Tax=Zhihengliuella salsuginis TaxID=578222 RepID=A0ABQ3GFK5_9MICC|nr:AAA family ATPase [Zhihengliuella salsuginis]GHD04494.1 chromosome partitioning protein [Zhihengliuella salsuginis]
MSRFLLITDSHPLESRLQACIDSAVPGSLYRVGAGAASQPPGDVLRRSLGEPTDVVVIGPDVATDTALRLASGLAASAPDVAVVLIAESDEDPELMRSAMRAGIRDVAPADADPAALRLAIERACAAVDRRRHPADADSARPRAEVITVLSPKGGVGKTTIATNLAVGLARVAPQRVVVVDLDLQFGDVASALNLEPEHVITDAAHNAAAQDSVVLKAYLARTEHGVYALCGPRTPAEADHLSPEQIGFVIDQLAVEFDYVVIDSAPGLGEHLLAALERTTAAVWICGMDVPSVRGTNNALAVLSELQLVPRGRHTVVNLADKRSGLTIGDIESTLGAPVDVVIPRSRTVPLSTNRGIPHLADGRHDSAFRGLSKLVDRFGAEEQQRLRQLHRREVVA